MSTHQVSFSIRGMFCPKCAGNIERALAALDGVVAAQVNYATERATVVYDPARVSTYKMVNAIRSIAYDTPVEHLTLHSDSLLYATSRRTVDRVLSDLQGVVAVSADLGARNVAVDVFPDYGRRGELERAFSGLGFRFTETGAADARMLFLLRTGILSVIQFLALWSAGAHAGLFASPGSLHAPLVILVVSLVALFGAGLPFYRFAFDAALQGQFDTSVVLALLASVLALISVPLGAVSSSLWLTDMGFIAATTLTTGWFIARALTLWVLPHFRRARRPVNVASKVQA